MALGSTTWHQRYCLLAAVAPVRIRYALPSSSGVGTGVLRVPRRPQNAFCSPLATLLQPKSALRRGAKRYSMALDGRLALIARPSPPHFPGYPSEPSIAGPRRPRSAAVYSSSAARPRLVSAIVVRDQIP